MFLFYQVNVTSHTQSSSQSPDVISTSQSPEGSEEATSDSLIPQQNASSVEHVSPQNSSRLISQQQYEDPYENQNLDDGGKNTSNLYNFENASENTNNYVQEGTQYSSSNNNVAHEGQENVPYFMPNNNLLLDDEEEKTNNTQPYFIPNTNNTQGTYMNNDAGEIEPHQNEYTGQNELHWTERILWTE